MKIESVDFFYLAMPDVTTAADGSQDALVVRVTAGGHVGWGECEAAPLPSIAAFVCPMSHGACRPVGASVLGETLDGPDDIRRIAATVAYNSMDLLQAPHTWSGIEMALWDVLGRARGMPAWKLLGYERAYPKVPYASVLFGATPQQTLERAKGIRANGFRAAKFGWAPFGESLSSDIAHLDAAREGLGPDGIVLIDAGQIFGEDVDAAAARLDAMERNRVTFFEEPFHGHAYAAYAGLRDRMKTVVSAGGEAAHNRYMAEHLIDFGKVGYIQIDCGRIGGLWPAKQVADYAVQRGVTYINHTFTSNLALSASMQPFAGLEKHTICEFPTGLKQLAVDLTLDHIAPDANGEIHVPDAPGLGIAVNPEALVRYRVDVEIRVGGQPVFVTPKP
ncbi:MULTISPECIES: mandelate racemase/muconate lactonizing enzyme family protein [unclassified Mesorhizobium]|uniref:mandelate racemase/muconate lactonizing enzyme family protein n=1 Tax=unclassified Mesorhizobium TaxID=325217 RepID=UPI00095B0FC5|nr:MULTISPECIES: mandelate racemase/muconate lactonizing enzyme family protein [unclassified Mesorhizobium]MBN9255669.1 mandelate racemase/muconate lactonizing enzyme family protein [Mesorhizobium sp.]OJX84087.1 MAG: mandelate racemase [Mesorhizobium sp. 65-26]